MNSHKTSCFHCGLPLPLNGRYEAVIAGEGRLFCCNGCKGVCLAIHEAGLQEFYNKMPEGNTLAPPPPSAIEGGIWSLPEVLKDFVTTREDVSEIQLLVEGIHCPACIWLIEHSLSAMQGVVFSEVNLAAKRLKLRWREEEVALPLVIQKLALLGYAAVPYTISEAQASAKKQGRKSLLRIGFAGFAMMNMMWVSISLWTGADDGEFRDFFHWLGFIFATTTLFYSGLPFLTGAITGLRNLRLTMDLPIAIGALATYSYSSWITISGSKSGEVYFDTVVAFIFVILVGRHLELSSRTKTADASQRLLEFQPKQAILVKNGVEKVVAVSTLKKGDVISIKPGTRIPVDGVVTSGKSEVDEAIVTGESLPVPKDTGDRVVTGSMNGSGNIRVKMEAELKENTLTRLAQLIEDAQASKAKVQRIADRIVPYFVAVTLFLALSAFLYWERFGFETALIIATSVLIITCPCALGLATPMAVTATTGYGSKRGILIRNGEAMESLEKADEFVFDKTGVLTEGRMEISSLFPTSAYTKKGLLYLASLIEVSSEHLLAKAIVAGAKERGIAVEGVDSDDFVNVPGFGVKGIIEGQSIIAGTKAWMEQQKIAIETDFLDAVHREVKDDNTLVYCGVNGTLAGVISLSDRIRHGALQTVKTLQNRGLRVTLLTGDRESVAREIAEELGIENIIAEVKPEGKQRYIAGLQAAGKIVAMVGDGINDAPALAKADVGIVVGSGADVSLESADIILMGSRIEKVLEARSLAEKGVRIIKQNLTFSLGYNAVMVPLAIAGFVNPVFAAVAMPVSSLIVILNASRIKLSAGEKRESVEEKPFQKKKLILKEQTI